MAFGFKMCKNTKKKGIIYLMAQIRAFASFFFDLGVPARQRNLRHTRTCNPMPPRRRAFRSNDFGLEPTTIPRDAKRQAEPPSRQGTNSRQNHFRCNPSRMLVEPYTHFAASNEHPRLNLLPRRDCPRTHLSQGLQRYRALAPNGAAQGKILSIILLFLYKTTYK